MSEIRQEEQSKIEQPIPEQAEPVLDTEMPEDFVEPEGKSGKWKTIKGEVEVEGKKVEVTYREKVIELPKHRQQETGIKRIRRRELLPPFPEGLYLSSEEAKETMKYKHMQESEKKPKIIFFGSYMRDKKFDAFYSHLTNGIYPSQNIYVHTLDYDFYQDDDSRDARKHKYLIKKFKEAGLYFQKIDNELYLEEQRSIMSIFTTPVFIFGGNPLFKKYAEKIWDPGTEEGPGKEVIMPGKIIGVEPLRWCHAECALIPTKRSLNVLFFETGEEDEQETKKEE